MGLSKYVLWYDWLISRAINRTTPEYTERHHIVPRSLGGTNERGNIVRLTYREHFLAHWLLVMLTTGAEQKKMRHALYRMSGKFGGRTIASWQYALARKAQRDARLGTSHHPSTRAKMSAAGMGNKRSLGFKHGPAHCLKISERLVGNTYSLGYKHSAETLAKRSRPASETTKARMSAAQRARWTKRLDRTVSEETRAKMSGSAKAKSPPNAETRARLSASIKASWAKRKGAAS
jgi:uncharacterized lipoprotein YmbA